MLGATVTDLLRADGRVVGVRAEYNPRFLPGQSTPLQSFRSDGNIDSSKPALLVRAKKAVIVATGGFTGNVNFRRMFDPRLTEEYCGLAGMPYSDQDGSGEMAAMDVGASLWGLTNHAAEHGSTLTKPISARSGAM